MNNIGLMWYKTVKVVTMDSITQIALSHTRCPHLMLAQGHNVSVSDCCWHRCRMLIMFMDKEKAQCALWFVETKSLASVQRKFRNEFRRKPPHVNNIRHWFEQFKETGSVCKRKSFGRPAVTKENVERIPQSFIHSPHK